MFLRGDISILVPAVFSDIVGILNAPAVSVVRTLVVYSFGHDVF
jgi:hypothetical protein